MLTRACSVGMTSQGGRGKLRCRNGVCCIELLTLRSEFVRDREFALIVGVSCRCDGQACAGNGRDEQDEQGG